MPNPGCVNGRQQGVTYGMPACLASYTPDPKATMTGVTPTAINFVYYVPQGNAEVNAILNTEGLAASPQQVCQAAKAFTTELNKRWEFYGRKLVPMDGPGNHDGLSQGQCGFPYYQGQCNLTPPDVPCYQAEADAIAAMKPAIVVTTSVFPQFLFRLAQDHILVIGGSAGAENIPESYYDQLSPYYYNLFPSGTQTAQQLGTYWCTKLAGRPVQFAGRGPSDVIPLTGSAPIRRLGIAYPSNNGDTIVKTVADQLAAFVNKCGTKTDEYAYASDITTAQQQSNTTVAAIKSNHDTSVVCLCDPIAPVFSTNTLDQQQYHPEFIVPGSGLLDYDVLGQLYNKNEMRYAFGPSELGDSIAFANTDAVKAWQDAGNSGQPDATENLQWSYFSFLGSLFEYGGPGPTPQTIQSNLFSAPLLAGDRYHPTLGFKNPYPYTAIKDFREVYWCATQVSPYNNQPGMYVDANGGRRFLVGSAVPGGTSELFPNGPCA